MNIDWLFNEFRGDRIEGYQLLDEKWENLDKGMAQFFFNVEKTDPTTGQKVKDSCSSGGGDHHVYAVVFSGSDFNKISISFSRCGSYRDFDGGYGAQVFMGVAKAISKYAQVRKPARFFWSPVPRSTHQKAGQAQTLNARKNVYERMSVGNMFPEKYVSIKENEWLRRDLYDKHYVPVGYPKIPEDMTNASHNKLKKQAVDDLRKKASELPYTAKDAAEASYQRERDRLEKEERDRLEGEASERLRAEINNLEMNPEWLQITDKVFLPHELNDMQKEMIQGFINLSSYQRFIINGQDEGKIFGFKLRDDPRNRGSNVLTAKIRLRTDENDDQYSGQEFEFPVKFLQKFDSTASDSRKRGRDAFYDRITAQGNINPNRLKVGEKVVLVLPVDRQERRDHTSGRVGFGAVGKIVGRELDFDYGDYGEPRLVFKIKFDDNVIPESERDPGDVRNFAFETMDEIVQLSAKTTFLLPYNDENVSHAKNLYQSHKNRLKDALENREINPQQLNVGDELFVMPDQIRRNLRRDYNSYDSAFGQIYKIVAVKFDNRSYHGARLIFETKKQNVNVLGSEVIDSLNAVEELDFVDSGSEDKIFSSNSNFIRKVNDTNIQQVKNVYKTFEENKKTFLQNPSTNPHGLEIGKKYILTPSTAYNSASSYVGYVGDLVGVVQNRISPDQIDSYNFLFKTDQSKSLLRYGSKDIILSAHDLNYGKPQPYSEEIYRKIQKLIRKKHVEDEAGSHKEDIVKDTPQQYKFTRRNDPVQQQLMSDQRNPQGIGIGDKVKIKPQDQLPAGAQISWRIDRSREFEVEMLREGYNHSTGTQIIATLKPGKANINVQYLQVTKSFVTPQLQKKIEKTTKLRGLHQAETGYNDRRIGDEVTITGGPSRNRTGHIIGWKLSGNNVVAQVLLDPQDPQDIIHSTYPTERASVALRYLRPVAANPSGVTELRPESMNYMNYLLMSNSYFEWKNK
jgi:hypothetical protein